MARVTAVMKYVYNIGGWGKSVAAPTGKSFRLVRACVRAVPLLIASGAVYIINIYLYIGAWGAKREIVSSRPCVRTRGVYV